MAYLRSLFLALTIAVQLVTLAYVLVVMGNTQAFDLNRSIVNTTDARALYYLGTVALIMMAGLAVMLWLERRGPSRRAAGLTGRFPGRSSRRSRGNGSDSGSSGGIASGGPTDQDSQRDDNRGGGNDDSGGSGGGDSGGTDGGGNSGGNDDSGDSGGGTDGGGDSGGGGDDSGGSSS